MLWMVMCSPSWVSLKNFRDNLGIFAELGVQGDADFDARAEGRVEEAVVGNILKERGLCAQVHVLKRLLDAVIGFASRGIEGTDRVVFVMTFDFERHKSKPFFNFRFERIEPAPLLSW